MAGVPRVLWTFWHDGRPPPLVAACLRTLRAAHPAPDWTFRLLTDADLPSPAARPDVHRLGAPHRADWLRLRVLATHGGVWLDATVVAVRPGRAAAWFDAADTAAELHCFRLSSEGPAARVLENWALAVPAGGSPFLRRWFVAFDRAVRVGLPAYCARMATPAGLPGGPASLPYLTMHAIGARLLARHAAVVRARPATPLAVHAAHGWWGPRIVHALAHAPAHALPDLVKLRGGEARGLALCAAIGWYDPAAALPRRLGWPRPPTPPWLVWLLLLAVAALALRVT